MRAYQLPNGVDLDLDLVQGIGPVYYSCGQWTFDMFTADNPYRQYYVQESVYEVDMAVDDPEMKRVVGIRAALYAAWISQSLRNHRRTICEGCDQYCPIDMPSCKHSGKVLKDMWTIASAKCPIGKW